MTHNYYQETVAEIERLIEVGNIQEARYLLEQELAQSFIPRKYETIFNELYDEIVVFNDEAADLTLITEKELLRNLLMGEMEEQVLALLNLEQLNIRNYQEIINEYLASDQDNIIKARMLELYVEQGLNETIDFKHDVYGNLSVNPSKLSLVSENAIVSDCFKQLEDRLIKNPSALEIAKQVLVEKMYLNYPLMYDDDNINSLLKQVVEETEKMLKSTV